MRLKSSEIGPKALKYERGALSFVARANCTKCSLVIYEYCEQKSPLPVMMNHEGEPWISPKGIPCVKGVIEAEDPNARSMKGGLALSSTDITSQMQKRSRTKICLTKLGGWNLCLPLKAGHYIALIHCEGLAVPKRTSKSKKRTKPQKLQAEKEFIFQITEAQAKRINARFPAIQKAWKKKAEHDRLWREAREKELEAGKLIPFPASGPQPPRKVRKNRLVYGLEAAAAAVMAAFVSLSFKLRHFQF